jgi:DNA invertase Pin-like site-specific DNA recombinase
VKAAIYVRVSSPGQAEEDKTSLPEQAKELRALAKARGWEVVEAPPFQGHVKLAKLGEGECKGCFGDPGISGDSVEGRPGLMAMKAMVEAGQVDVVAVRDLNRLARSELAAQRIHDVLESHGVALVTPAMDYDYSNLTHRLMLGIFGSVEAYAKRWLVANLARGRAAKCVRGAWGVKVEPYGYKWSKAEKKPVVVPEEAEGVRLIFALADRGMTTTEIARELRARGLPTRTHRPVWHDGEVANILRRPEYKGEWYTQKACPARPATAKRKALPELKAMPAEAASLPEPAALVTEAVWRRGNRLLGHHGKRTRRPPKLFLLAGMAVCGECGGAMTGRTPLEGLWYYGCNAGIKFRTCPARHVPGADLEEAVWNLVRELAANPEAAAACAQETEAENLPEWRQELGRVERAIADCEKQIERAQRAYMAGDFELEAYAKREGEVKADREAWAERAADLRGLVQKTEATADAVARVQSILVEIGDQVDGYTFEQKRDVLRRLHVRVVVTADDWAKLRGRAYKARVEWAGAAFAGEEDLLASTAAVC